MNINDLGIVVNEEVLTGVILSQLNMTKEEAVLRLAEKLGVDLSPKVEVEETLFGTGDTVETEKGAAQAVVLTTEEVELLRKANQLTQKIFG